MPRAAGKQPRLMAGIEQLHQALDHDVQHSAEFVGELGWIFVCQQICRYPGRPGEPLQKASGVSTAILFTAGSAGEVWRAGRSRTALLVAQKALRLRAAPGTRTPSLQPLSAVAVVRAGEVVAGAEAVLAFLALPTNP